MVTKLDFDEKISVQNDPFKKAGIQAIHMHSYPKYDEAEWTASIEFKNGMTEGKQKFEGVDFFDVVNQMKEFINQLK